VSWEGIGALAELLGAVGVIISLVYLAWQIRQNTNALRGTAHEAFVSRFTNLASSIGSSPQASDLLARGHRDYGSLSPSERLQYGYLVGALLVGAEATFHQYRRGNLEEAIWQTKHATLPGLTVFPGFQTYWGRVRTSYTPEFQSLVDSEIERSSGTSF
jgi:hypothetical protein